MSDQKSDSPRINKLEIKDESVKELTDAESSDVVGGMRRAGGACGDTGTTLSTCTKITTSTGVPTTETC